MIGISSKLGDAQEGVRGKINAGRVSSALKRADQGKGKDEGDGELHCTPIASGEGICLKLCNSTV